MLTKNVVIAALFASVKGQVAKDPKKADPKVVTPTPKAADPKVVTPAAATIKRDDWEDLLGRDLCDDWGTHGWELADAALKKA
jgi:hypothetical protein